MFRPRRIGEASEFSTTPFLYGDGNVLKRDAIKVCASLSQPEGCNDAQVVLLSLYDRDCSYGDFRVVAYHSHPFAGGVDLVDQPHRDDGELHRPPSGRTMGCFLTAAAARLF